MQPNMEAVYEECEKHGYNNERVDRWLATGRIFPIENGYKIGIHPYVSYLEMKALLGTPAARNSFPQITSVTC